MQALKRIGKPDDVADVIVFLASDKARWIIWLALNQRRKTGISAHTCNRVEQTRSTFTMKQNEAVFSQIRNAHAFCFYTSKAASCCSGVSSRSIILIPGYCALKVRTISGRNT